MDPVVLSLFLRSCIRMRYALSRLRAIPEFCIWNKPVTDGPNIRVGPRLRFAGAVRLHGPDRAGSLTVTMDAKHVLVLVFGCDSTRGRWPVIDLVVDFCSSRAGRRTR